MFFADLERFSIQSYLQKSRGATCFAVDWQKLRGHVGYGRELRVCVSVKKRLHIYQYKKGLFEMVKVREGRREGGREGEREGGREGREEWKNREKNDGREERYVSYHVLLLQPFLLSSLTSHPSLLTPHSSPFTLLRVILHCLIIQRHLPSWETASLSASRRSSSVSL